MDANTSMEHGEAIGHVVLDVGRLVFEKVFQDAGGRERGEGAFMETRTLQLLQEDGQNSGRVLNVCWSFVADSHPEATLGDEV